MNPTGAAEAKDLPLSATITIHKRRLLDKLDGKVVEVSPNGGRVHIQNDDNQAYRLRLKETDASKGIDILIPAGGCVSVMVKKDDEFQYLVMDPDEVKNGIGGGGIRN